MLVPPSEDGTTVSPTIRSLFLVFFRIGCSAFGGGTSGWIRHELVRQKRWLTDDQFFTALTLSQALPGPGAVNISVYIGLQVGGWRGSLAAALGMLMPAMSIILGLAVLYAHFGNIEGVQFVLGGLAAAGIGLTLSMATSRLVRMIKNPLAVALSVAVFIAAGIFRLPLLVVIAMALPPSVLLAVLRERKDNGR